MAVVSWQQSRNSWTTDTPSLLQTFCSDRTVSLNVLYVVRKMRWCFISLNCYNKNSWRNGKSQHLPIQSANLQIRFKHKPIILLLLNLKISMWSACHVQVFPPLFYYWFLQIKCLNEFSPDLTSTVPTMSVIQLEATYCKTLPSKFCLTAKYFYHLFNFFFSSQYKKLWLFSVSISNQLSGFNLILELFKCFWLCSVHLSILYIHT